MRSWYPSTITQRLRDRKRLSRALGFYKPDSGVTALIPVTVVAKER
jgi:hypothetical protein